jgi:16S rRNA (cytosine967-C5)-methyltransferase
VSDEKPRQIAMRILQRGVGGGFVEDRLEAELARTTLTPPDRRLCQELTYGIVRWQATLDWLISRKTDGREQNSKLQNLLRLGLYQIFWLDRIPDHAAVHETVELARQSGFNKQAGFVNAILRGYLRESDATRRHLLQLKTEQPALGYSHPAWLVARWQSRWGTDRTAKLMEWNNTPPKTFARVNALKADPGRLLAQWREEDVEYDFVRRDWLEENTVFELKSYPLLSRLPSFQQGLFYVQDPSTLLAVRELEPQPGESVLDFCAAPGGKLTALAQLMRNEGRLLAHDTSPDRLKLVEENCARLGITCVQTILPSVLEAQGSATFDCILVDAPCSNTGVMRRRVDLRWRIQPKEIERLRTAQIELLRQAGQLLKLGGRLVYSTCSLEPEENPAVVNDFLAGYTDFKLQRSRELLPFADAVDGSYVAKLVKSG